MALLLAAFVAGCSGSPSIPLISKPAPRQLSALEGARGLAGTIYFAQGNRLWRLRGGNLAPITPANASYSYPAITNDGSATAATFVTRGQAVMAFGGPDFTNLTLAKPLQRDPHNGSIDIKATFSPNGSRVAFMSDRAKGFSDEAIWEGTVNGGVHQVSFPPDASGGDDAPAYLTDGTGIVFTAWRMGHAGLDHATVPFGKPRVLLTATDRDFLDPAPGPGDQLAFTQRQGEVENIYVAAGDGTGARALTTFNDARQPTWSPDGKNLLFISPHAGTFDLWMVPVTGGQPRQLTTSGDLDANSRAAWSAS